MPAILKVICLTISTVFPLLGICSGCEEVNWRLKDLDIYQRCSWYQYPPKIQHAMIIIIIESQNLDPFKMCGSLTASRETCKKVSTIESPRILLILIRICFPQGDQRDFFRIYGAPIVFKINDPTLE